MLLDFLDNDFEEKINKILKSKVENVISDMASNSTGHKNQII